ncbi:MAG: T9SS type A sorting domain-containing protein, partial [Bacteroidia bacterium]|nr:T9SS type A sorting domain-containing protein [Bacteroidia bacterium]
MPQMNISIVKTNILCNGESTGALDLTVNSGASPFTFVWNDGTTSEDRSNLASGFYTVTVTDAKGCTKIINKAVLQPKELKLSIDRENSTCFKSNDGSLDAKVQGGTAPYTYLWNDGVTSEDRIDLAKGTYRLTVTDAHGCSISKARYISAPKRTVVKSTITNVNCFGNNDGAIDLTVTGGNGGNTYLWNTGATNKNISGITAGTYSVEITDKDGCKTSRNLTVVQPDAIALSTTSTDVLCHGNNSGAANVTVTGGTANYSYNWSNGSVAPQANNLVAGTYSVEITDANGCTATEHATITEPMQLVAATSNVDVTCNGGTNGEVTASIAGGTAPYSYEWDNGNLTQTNNNLTAGTYSVTITDNNGCSVNSSATIAQPLAMSTFIMNTNVSCKNGTNGTAEALVANGVAPLSYMWSTGATTKTIDNLSSGVYSVTVTDANGCEATDFVIVNEPSQMLMTQLAGAMPTCNGGSDAEVMSMVYGGVAPYSFMWNTGATMQGLTMVAAGTYTLTVTDSRGCELTSSTTVADPALLTISAVSQNAICSGTNSAAIDITVSGGNPAYTYQWSNGATTEDLTNIASGLYTVTVTDIGDEGGCSVTETITITSTPSVSVSTCPSQEVALMPGPEVDCHYPQIMDVIYTGVSGITVKVYRDTPPKELLNTFYNVQNGQTLTTSSMNIGEKKFDSKTYFTVDNGTSVTTNEAHTSCSDPLLGLEFGDFHVTGFQNADGTSYSEATHGAKASATVTANAFSGTAPYTYSWSNGMTGANINIYVADNTILTVTVTDANGCSATASHQINVIDIRSTNYPDKVLMCKDPLTNPYQKEVKVEDIAKKLAYGWTLGPCGYDFSQPNACGSVVELPCECNSGVQAMALIYDGPANVDVDFYNEDKIDADELIKSFTNVQPGDSLLAYSYEIGENKFSKFGVAVDGVFLNDFHLSCSVPIQGLTAGDLTVYGFVDGDGSACHMPAPPAAAANCDCDGKITEMTVIYDGPANATVSVGPNSSGTNPYTKTGVNPGDTLIVNLGNIGNDWYYIVNGVQDAYMHASCSDEIMGNVNASKSDFGSLGNYPNPDAGNNLGTFLVIGHVDENGNVCTLQNYAPRYAEAGSIQSKLDADFINIFPNPSTGNVTIEYVMNANMDVEIKVMDITGRTVEQKSQNANSGMNSLKMDLSHLNNGVYFVNLNNTLENKVLKFVIQK